MSIYNGILWDIIASKVMQNHYGDLLGMYLMVIYNRYTMHMDLVGFSWSHQPALEVDRLEWNDGDTMRIA